MQGSVNFYTKINIKIQKEAKNIEKKIIYFLYIINYKINENIKFVYKYSMKENIK